MKICYGLLFSNPTKLSQMVYLLERLEKNNLVLVHIDLKQTELYHTLKKMFMSYENIHFCVDRIHVQWGHISMVEAMFILYNTSLAFDYSYFTLLSESCLPVKSDKQIKNFLSRHPEKEFIEAFQQPSLRFRLHLKHTKIDENYRKHRNFHAHKERFLDFFFGKFIGNPIFASYDFYYGGQWSTLSRECIAYVVQAEKEKHYIEKYQHTLYPDEHLVQEIIMTSTFKNRLYKNGIRSASLVYVDFHVLNAPKQLTRKDLSKFIDKEDVLYARKFDDTLQKEVYQFVVNRQKMDE